MPVVSEVGIRSEADEVHWQLLPLLQRAVHGDVGSAALPLEPTYDLLRDEALARREIHT